MQIGINLATAKFRDDIIKLINGCRLPPSVISVCLEAVKGGVDEKANAVIRAEEKEIKTEDK